MSFGVFIYLMAFVYEIPYWPFIPLFLGISLEKWSREIVSREKIDEITGVCTRAIDLYEKPKRLLSDTWKMIDLARLDFGFQGTPEYKTGWEMYRKLDDETIEYRGL